MYARGCAALMKEAYTSMSTERRTHEDGTAPRSSRPDAQAHISNAPRRKRTTHPPTHTHTLHAATSLEPPELRLVEGAATGRAHKHKRGVVSAHMSRGAARAASREAAPARRATRENKRTGSGRAHGCSVLSPTLDSARVVGAAAGRTHVCARARVHRSRTYPCSSTTAPSRWRIARTQSSASRV